MSADSQRGYAHAPLRELFAVRLMLRAWDCITWITGMAGMDDR